MVIKMRDDDSLMQKMAIEMENTDGLKRHSGGRINNTCLVEYVDEGKGKEKDCLCPGFQLEPLRELT